MADPADDCKPATQSDAVQSSSHAPERRQSSEPDAAEPDAAAQGNLAQADQPCNPACNTDVAAPAGGDGGAAGSDLEEAGGPAEDVRACLFSLLQRKCPELRITTNALGMLEGLLDQIVQKVLAEALQEPQAGGEGDSEPLTSLAIQKAVKKLLPKEQLPASALKNSWHLDKQSLRGIKRRRAEQDIEVADAKQEPQDADGGTELTHR